jgi:formate hydrogenlyase transcriptional activator
LALLQSYQWPGNIRELQNVIERSVVVSEGSTLSVSENWFSSPSTQPSDSTLNTALLKKEKDLIEAALRESKGRVAGPTGAARKLGIPASTLERRIRTLKIAKYRFRGK